MAFIRNLLSNSIGTQVFLQSLDGLSSSPSFQEAASSQMPSTNDTNPFNQEFVPYYHQYVPIIHGHLLNEVVQPPEDPRGQDNAPTQNIAQFQTSENLQGTEPDGGAVNSLPGISTASKMLLTVTDTARKDG